MISSDICPLSAMPVPVSEPSWRGRTARRIVRLIECSFEPLIILLEVQTKAATDPRSSQSTDVHA